MTIMLESVTKVFGEFNELPEYLGDIERCIRTGVAPRKCHGCWMSCQKEQVLLSKRKEISQCGIGLSYDGYLFFPEVNVPQECR